MHKCCTLNQTNRPQRRINGLQLPLNYLQVIGWIVFVITCVLNFAILVQIQVAKVKITTQIIFAILYVAHVVSHVTATLLDPSEKDLRKLEINTVPEFDRNIHAHVIENGRCHICNIYTSSKKTKHCSLCNKCVNRFDHHCKWLNNCVGQRNYGAFIASVTTAFLLSLMTALLCLVDIVLFVTDPQQLSVETQHVANCSIMDSSNMSLHHDIKICRHSIMFLIFLVIFCVSAVAVACALMHLLCFHIYIAMLGVSTYEYILRSSISRTTPTQTNKCTSCPCKLPGKLYIVSKSKTNNNVKSEESATKPAERDHKDGGQSSTISGGERNVASFIGILVNNELDKAKRIFMNDKNRIHPQEEIS